MEDVQDSISDHLKCPICFEIPKDKMFQCRNGHRFCEDCYKQFREKYCPQCKDHIPKNPIRCKAVEELLDSIALEFPCQFQGVGCKVTKDRKFISEHNASCKHDFEKFGPLENVCGFFGFKNCSFTFNRGSTDEGLAHFKEVHKMRSIKALLPNKFTIQYKDFKEIFNYSEVTVFIPLIFDQRWWGHHFIYVIVIRFNPQDKTLQFLPFYLTHGLIMFDGSKGFPGDVEFNYELEYTSATVRPQHLLNCAGKSLNDSIYFAIPFNSKMNFNKENSMPPYSSFQIQVSKNNTPQPPKDVRDDELSTLITLKPSNVFTPSILNKRWPPVIRGLGTHYGSRNWDQVQWIPWNDFEECKPHFSSLSTYEGLEVLICRANINEKWLIGAIYWDKEKDMKLFNAHFRSPNLVKWEESFDLTEDFEVLHMPPKSFEWAAWKVAKGMEGVTVHDEDKTLLICKWKTPGFHFIGVVEEDMELDDCDDIDVLVFSDKEKEGEHKCLDCGKYFPCARGLKRHNKREHK